MAYKRIRGAFVALLIAVVAASSPVLGVFARQHVVPPASHTLAACAGPKPCSRLCCCRPLPDD